MLSKKMLNSLNGHLNEEFYSAYFYRSMAGYATSLGLSGIANWFQVQVQEELTHVDKLINYMNQQGGRVSLKSIKEPPQDFTSVLDLYEKTLEHEQRVTGLINELVSMARAENDNATEVFLQWFVSEQIEEESLSTDIILKLKMVGSDGNGLFLIDSELNKRTFGGASGIE